MAFDLCLEDTSNEDEDDAEDEDDISADIVLDCIKCGEPIRLTEELFIFKIARPFVDPTSRLVTFHEFDRNGVLLEEAAVHCFGCWEEVNEEAQVACDDVPPVTHPNGLCICDNCGSDINEGETMGLATYGEVHWSSKMPNGIPQHEFEEIGDSKHICIVCIHNMDLEYVRPDYAANLRVRDEEPNEACSDGLSKRCWRHGTCIAHCHSHRK